MSNGLTSLPTLTSGSLGNTKSDFEPVVYSNTILPSGEWNTIATASFHMAQEIGLTNGTTPGSLVSRSLDLENVVTSGSVFALNGLSGSLQRTISNKSYLLAGPYITLLTNSLGQIEISGATPGPNYTFLAGPNITINSSSNVIEITGSTNNVTQSNLIFSFNRNKSIGDQFDIANSITNAAVAVNTGSNTNYYWITKSLDMIKINQGSLVGSSKYMVMPIKTSALSYSLPKRYQVEMHIEGADAINTDQYIGLMFSWRITNNTGMGTAISNNSTVGLTPMFITSTLTSLNQAGNSFMASYGPQTETKRGAKYTFNVEHFDNSVRIIIWADTLGSSWWWGTSADSYRVHSDLYNTTASVFQTSSYIPETVAVFYYSLNGSGGDMLIRDLIIRKHPMDR